jgi:hypothetical protein
MANGMVTRRTKIASKVFGAFWRRKYKGGRDEK